MIPSQTFTDGAGPFGAYYIDTGPAGLTYGTDRVLYVGNVNADGDYHRLDLATDESTIVTTFGARVYASAPFDALHKGRRGGPARPRTAAGRFSLDASVSSGLR